MNLAAPCYSSVTSSDTDISHHCCTLLSHTIVTTLGLVGILYMAFMAVRTLPKHTGLFGVVRDRATELLTEIEVSTNYDLIGKPIALLMARFTVSCCDRCTCACGTEFAASL
jgi:hypothetical protein